jgi:lipopolysaccharide transport system permease protein
MTDITIIKPKTNFFHVDIPQLLKWRFLFYLMTRRNVKILYQNTAIGVLWVVLQSFLTVIVFSFLLKRIGGGIDANGIPYILFAFSGILLWQGFSKALTQAGGSLIAQQGIITKVFFPRLLIPGSTVASVGVDMIANFIFYGAVFIFYGVTPKLIAPLGLIFLLFALVIAFFMSLVICAISLRYRDAQLILPFLLQIGQFLTPVFYPISAIPGKWHFLVALNPVASIAELTRWSTLQNYPFPSFLVLISSLISLSVIAITGIYLFNKNDRYIAELL